MDTRERILDCAVGLLDRGGLDAVSMSRLRRAADVSNGSLYHHFASKADVVAALQARALSSWRAAFAEALAAAGEPRAVIVAGVAAHLRWAADNPALARLVLTQIDDGAGSGAEGAVTEQRAFLAHVQRVLDAQVAAGELAALAPRVRYAVWLGPAQEYLRHWLLGRHADDPTAVSRVLGEAAWRSLAGKA